MIRISQLAQEPLEGVVDEHPVLCFALLRLLLACLALYSYKNIRIYDNDNDHDDHNDDGDDDGNNNAVKYGGHLLPLLFSSQLTESNLDIREVIKVARIIDRPHLQFIDKMTITIFFAKVHFVTPKRNEHFVPFLHCSHSGVWLKSSFVFAQKWNHQRWGCIIWLILIIYLLPQITIIETHNHHRSHHCYHLHHDDDEDDDHHNHDHDYGI